jgi:hypothetical protein
MESHEEKIEEIKRLEQEAEEKLDEIRKRKDVLVSEHIQNLKQKKIEELRQDILSS